MIVAVQGDANVTNEAGGKASRRLARPHPSPLPRGEGGAEDAEWAKAKTVTWRLCFFVGSLFRVLEPQRNQGTKTAGETRMSRAGEKEQVRCFQNSRRRREEALIF